MSETRHCPRCGVDVRLGPVGLEPENYLAHLEAHEAGQARPEERAASAGMMPLIKAIERLRLRPGECLLITVDDRVANDKMLAELRHVVAQVVPAANHVLAVPSTVAMKAISPEAGAAVERIRNGGVDRAGPRRDAGQPNGVSDLKALVKPQLGFGR